MYIPFCPLQISLVSDKTSGKPRGYAFIEFEHERDMHCKYLSPWQHWTSCLEVFWEIWIDWSENIPRRLQSVLWLRKKNRCVPWHKPGKSCVIRIFVFFGVLAFSIKSSAGDWVVGTQNHFYCWLWH